MNLTTGKWIPVVWEDGHADKVSLLDVFQQGEIIRDLAVRPHERIALMRLLICIAQAALDGPKDRDDWQACQKRLPQAAADYLAKWKHAFELFGAGQRFLQVPNVTRTASSDENKLILVSKLDSALATGAASTLFDNNGGVSRIFSEEQLALMLLVFQSFSSGGLLSECIWNGIRTKKAGNAAAPGLAGKMVHTIVLSRKSLLCSIWMNLINKEQILITQNTWGKPVWEMMPQGPDDNVAISNAVNSYMGRLVPISRAVSLQDDNVSMIWGNALNYPSFVECGWREPMATIYVSSYNQNERRQLEGTVTKALWRELHVITVLRHDENNHLGGPLALQNIDDNVGVDIFVGAIVHEPRMTTNIIDAIESVLYVPSGLFKDVGRQLYKKGVAQAEYWRNKINRAISTCHSKLHDNLDKAEFRKRGNLIKQKAAAHYWTAIEQQVPQLLAIVQNPMLLDPDNAGKEHWHGTQWGKALARAAREAYELACPHSTPRQMQAYCQGLKVLFKPFENNENKPAVEEEEEA